MRMCWSVSQSEPTVDDGGWRHDQAEHDETVDEEILEVVPPWPGKKIPFKF